MKPTAIWTGIAILAALASSPVVIADETGQYVSKEEHEKLKRDFDRMKALMRQMEKRLTQQAPASQTGSASTKDMVEIKDELEAVKQETLEAKEEVKSVVPGFRKFLLTGYAFAGYSDSEQSNSSFNAGFFPILLWRINDNIFVEAEAEFELEDGKTNVALEFSQLSYLLNDYVTLGVGKFLNPTNYFIERLEPAWINKLPDQPLSVDGKNRIQGKTQLGAQVRGGVPLRMIGLDSSRLGYAFYASNGSELTDDGSLNHKNFSDIDNNKLVGGRVGFVPWPGFEVGYGFEVGGVRDSLNKSLDTTTHVVDANYVQSSPMIGGRLDFRAQWAWRTIDRSRVVGLDFKNKVNGGYGQIAYQPSLLNIKWIRDLEGVFRYDRMDQPSGSSFTDRSRYTVGLNYYLAPTTMFKFAYEFDDRTNDKDNDTLLFQVTTGF